ncbi:hypothetical protein KFU94_26590 [Chloroflexi bacterium TSY]|nr:hypothetical protein [Chloroflexi bacterium TSY]
MCLMYKKHYRVVEEIYQEAARDPEIGLEPEQIIDDFTGGTTPMSVGIALACQARGPMQYTYGGTRLAASMPILVDFW